MVNEELRKKIRGYNRVVVLTGAGISAESGVPTFRGEDGLWRKYRPEDLANPFAFERDPKLVWEWYDWRRCLIKPLFPNAAHYVLAEMENYYKNFILITQNVDGLHKKAGSRNIIELHGNIWKMQCTIEKKVIENYETPLKELPPKCDCNALMRPYVVWFGEELHPGVYEASIKEATNCELFIVIGTSAVVQPAASLPVYAKESKALLIEINIDDTPLTPITDISIKGKAAEILPKLWKEIMDN